MLGHLGLNVPDLRTAKHYYDAFVAQLGFESFLDHEDQFAYRPAGNKPGTYLFFYPSALGDSAVESPAFNPTRTGLQHLAFVVKSRSVVRGVHETAVGLGSTILHEPKIFPEYPQPYFATFWTDPFGFVLEAVCHHDRA